MENLLKNIKKQSSYKIFIENHPAILLIIDSISGKIIDANKSAENFYGYSRKEFDTKNIEDINIYSKEDIFIEMEMAKKQNRNFFKFIHKLKDGTLKNVHVVSYPINYNEKEYLFSLIMEENKKNDNKINIDILDLMNNADDAFCLMNSAEVLLGEVLYLNNAFAKMMGMDAESIKALTIEDIFIDSDELININKKYIGGTYTLNLKNKDKLSVQVNCMKIKTKGTVYSLLQVKPIEYKVVSQIKITSKFIYNTKKKFKNIPGYLIGIELYSNSLDLEYIRSYYEYIETYILDSLRENDIGFYISKEPFQVLCYSTDSLFDITVMLNEFVNRFEKDEKYQFYDKFCKFRVGVSQKGFLQKNQIEFFQNSSKSFDNYQYNTVIYANRNSDFLRSAKLKQDLPKAISNNEFVLYAQAIVNIDTKLVEGVEILVRWQHKDYGLVYPNEFIKYAEISGYIKDIDLWVLSESLKFIHKNKLQIKNLKFHVNLSSRSFELSTIYKMLTSYESKILNNLVLEITEQSNHEILNETFKRVVDTGVALAIDDFGTGYSSFERILKSGVKYIKIDKSLIENIVKNTDDLIILQTILSMCENLRIQVIAEGVEKLEQLEFLDARRCNIIQGFLFDRPDKLDNLFGRINKINKKIQEIMPIKKDYGLLEKTFYNKGRIFIQNLDENFKFKNPNIQLAEKLGLSIEAISNLKFTDLLNENEDKYFFEGINKVRQFEDTISVTTQIHSGDEIFDVICAGEIGLNGEYRMYIEFLDKNKNDELKLIGFSKSYLEAFAKAPVGMIVITSDFKIQRWNKSASNIFGFLEDEVVGNNLVKLITRNDKLNIALNKALLKGNYDGVLDNIDRYGNELKCQWNVNLISDKAALEKIYICIIQDITQKLDLEKERNKINNALNQTKSAIIMTDLEGDFTYINKAFTKMTGYTEEEILNKNISILSAKEQSSEFYDDLWSTINSGSVWNGEFRNRKKDGTLYWIKSSIYPIVEEKMIQGFICIQLDITNEKELLNVNENLKIKLYEQDKIASLGLLTTGIMHEINNPLSYIQGNVEYILEAFKGSEFKDLETYNEFNEVFLDVSMGIEQIKEIADGLKKYIFKNKLDIPEKVDFLEILKEVLLISKNQYKYYANIKLEYDKKCQYLVSGFSSKLKQVIMNLVINSSHAIEYKKMESLGEIKINLKNIDEYVVIKFSDNGIGMDKKVLEKMFEPFFTTKKSGIGSGLGLSITKDIIVNKHNGFIECTSKKGIGTVFEIRLLKWKN